MERLAFFRCRRDHRGVVREGRPPGALAGRHEEPGTAAEKDALLERQLHRLSDD